jgi:soluble lytic murein transglycosylase
VWQRFQQQCSDLVRRNPLRNPVKNLHRSHVIALAVASVCALALGAAVSLVETGRDRPTDKALSESAIPEALGDAPDTRIEALTAIANGAESADRSRARYLLALNAIETGQPEVAIDYLDNLDRDYPLLADWTLWQRARAQRALNETEAERQTLEQLLDEYGDRPVAAEALYELGNGDTTSSDAWNTLLERFPTHPRAADAAMAQLTAIGIEQSAALPALRVLIRHHYRSDIVQWLDRAVTSHKAQLTPEDWQHIAFGYWEELEYRKAGLAYAQAPSTAQTRYRQARSLQIGGERNGAIAAYRNAIATYPKAPETAMSLLYLSRLVPEKDAMALLDQAIADFPDQAAEALYDRALLLEKLNSQTSAQQAKQSILTQYGQSETAATLRWKNAKQAAKTGDAQKAIAWAQEIVEEQPDSQLAPEALFWIGKWQAKIGDSGASETTFTDVLRRYPWSYYAWRSAALLGWDVGDFTTVRDRVSQIDPPVERLALPAGSDALGELYALGLDRDAWSQWQVEFETVQTPSFEDQYTDGILRTAVGDYLDGLFMLTSLNQFDDPSDRDKFRDVHDSDSYWLALFPFPYRDVVTPAAQRRQLDPLFVIGLIRQESRFVSDIRSVADAVGLMQVLPSTADWIAAEKGEAAPIDLVDPSDNVRLGTLYFQYVHDQWDNNSMLAVASYNAGPGNVEGWLDEFGLGDPDEFVEKIPFDETRGYVSSVFGNYWNYMRLYDPRVRSMLEAL